MHNNIMAAGSKDRPPMLGPGRYSQWRSRFLRYIDTKNNGEGLKKCILDGPYVPTSVQIQAVAAAEGRPAVQQHIAIETGKRVVSASEDRAQLQEKGFAKLTGNNVNTKFAKPSVLGKPVLQPLKKQPVVRQPTVFKSGRPKISKPRFASQVDENNDLSKPVTTHYLPKRRESAHAKPHNMIAPSSSRYSLKYMYIVQSYKGRTQSLVAEKTYISENRASRNFDLMINKMVSAKNNTSGPVPQC
ncbi:hypothetical protein Tco_0462923 [Tanacetum coccineum]